MTSWQPSSTIANLKKRAQIIQRIREFFITRNVLEVETPLMCHTSVTDPFIESIKTIPIIDKKEQTYYLQTSPEYAMKRLLTAGSGSIFQICKAFRQEESGAMHNPEFTMLEWYRVGFDHHQLMDEMDELLQFVSNTKPAKRFSYKELFLSFLNFDPHTASIDDLKQHAEALSINLADDDLNKDDWLQILLTHCIEPKMGFDAPYFIYDFPESQSALAKIQNTNPRVASRFEVYINGIELANGFHELQDEKEQRKRFEKNNIARMKNQQVQLAIDEKFLAALNHGLPDCAGVALGVDRLIMIATKTKTISDVIAFDFENT